MSRGLGKNPPTPNRRFQELMHWKNTQFRFDQEYICDLCDNKICFLWKSFHDSMSQNAQNCLKIQIHWTTSLLQLKLECRYHNHHIDHPGILEKSVSPASSAEALSPTNTMNKIKKMLASGSSSKITTSEGLSCSLSCFNLYMKSNPKHEKGNPKRIPLGSHQNPKPLTLGVQGFEPLR